MSSPLLVPDAQARDGQVWLTLGDERTVTAWVGSPVEADALIARLQRARAVAQAQDTPGGTLAQQEADTRGVYLRAPHFDPADPYTPPPVLQRPEGVLTCDY